MIVSMETKIGQKLVNNWSIVKATYCNKTIISSKLLNAKCYFNYVINIILRLATYNYVCSFYTWLCSPQACNNNKLNKNTYGAKKIEANQKQQLSDYNCN